MAVSKDIIEQIKERSNLAEIASEYVELKSSGRNLVGLSPFKQEKTPSFYVYDDGSRYKCFSSGKSGDAITFVMEMRGLDFLEAVHFLASRLGMSIEQGPSVDKAEQLFRKKHKQALKYVLDLAEKSYLTNLNDEKGGLKARAYLESRGFNKEAIAKFSIGYAPRSWDFIRERVEAGLSDDEISLFIKDYSLEKLLLELGLLKEKSEGDGLYDAFRERIIFPIAQMDSQTIAFGGRIIDKDAKAPKYINSSDSEVYHKREVLYGFSQAQEQVRKLRRVVLVEGYFDVIGLWQKGLGYALATCGTAISSEHVNLLKRFADRVSIVFDGDDAGVKAAVRCFELFINSGLEVTAVVLPKGEDPDSLAKKYEKKELVSIFAKHSKPLFEVYLEYLSAKTSSSSAVAKGKIAKSFVEVIANVSNPVEKEFFVKKAAAFLEVSEESINQLFPAAKSKSNKVAIRAQTQRDSKPSPVSIMPTGSRAIKSYLFQLLVALVSSPKLSQTVLEIPSLLEVKGDEELSTKVFSFVEELSKSKLSKVGSTFTTEGDHQENTYQSFLWDLLKKLDLPADEVIAEAKRQNKVGGSAPDKLIAEASKVTERFTLRSQVEKIRSQESSAGDGLSLEELAQKKLEAKRTLDRL